MPEIELEEFRQLQAIITGGSFLVLAVLVVGLPLWIELVHRAFVRLAINRVLRLEDVLRSGGTVPYDGPLVAKSLGRDFVRGQMMREARLSFMWVPYIATVVIVVVIGVIGW